MGRTMQVHGGVRRQTPEPQGAADSDPPRVLRAGDEAAIVAAVPFFFSFRALLCWYRPPGLGSELASTCSGNDAECHEESDSCQRTNG